MGPHQMVATAVVAEAAVELVAARSAAARLSYGVTRDTTGALWSTEKRRVRVNALSPVMMKIRGWNMWLIAHGANYRHACIVKSLKAGKIQYENMKDSAR